MNFAPDLLDDCLLVDGGEAVVLHGTQSVAITHAKRGSLELADVEFRQMSVDSHDLAWVLPEVQMGGVQPRPGDAIEDGEGHLWTIVSAVRSPLTGVWRTVTRRQR